MIYVGTSGFSYREWKGIFYPEKLSAKEYLNYYARHFTTTEINNTFYRSPQETTAKAWSEQVPDHFRFALKLNRKNTHQKRLKEVDEEMAWFLKGAAALGDKLGTILVQLPPYFRKDLASLSNFLQQNSGMVRLAVEFRHESWFCQDTFDLLEEHETSLVVVEADERPALRQITAPFVYLRLRKSGYKEEELQDWIGWIRSQQREVFAYFKHEEEAPGLAQRLQDALRA